MSEHLQGYFDYLLRNQAWIIVIEAKHEDLYNGFTQLATELIALDQWDKSPECDPIWCSHNWLSMAIWATASSD